MEYFASYEKSVEAIVTRTRHTVRMRINARAVDIRAALSEVPDNAILTIVNGDETTSDEDIQYGEMYFDEEQVN